MTTYVIRRLLQAIPILIGIAVICFFIVRLAPGSPVDKFRGGRVSPEVIQNIIKLYQLDQPLPAAALELADDLPAGLAHRRLGLLVQRRQARSWARSCRACRSRCC